MNILVTGCSRGVGLEICRVLLREQHTVYGVARSHTDEFKALEQEYEGRLFFKSVDLSDSEGARKSVFKEFVTNDIVLHGFVNNAAIAPMVLTKYAIRNMLLHHTKGSIVHVSSISVHTGYKGLAMYASSKGALEAFSKNTAREWGVKGIRSNCVVPGFMATAMSASLTDEQRDKIYARTSLKAATSVESVAEMVSFLLSDKAASVTAQNIHVDNGTI